MATPPRPPRQPVELEPDVWPPSVRVRADYQPRAPVVSVPPAVSHTPPGLKRFGWLQTFVLGGLALLAFGWKAHDVVADYPTKVEVAATVEGSLKLERQLREQAWAAVVTRLANVEDAGAHAAAVETDHTRRLDALDKRRGVRSVVAPPLP